jgi:hypothetical protein
MEDSDVTRLLFEESYRMFARAQAKYTLNASGGMENLLMAKYDFFGGKTKFMNLPFQWLTKVSGTFRGIEINMDSNSTQMLINSEQSSDTGKLPVPITEDRTSAAGYVSGRVGIEGRVPTFALTGRDAPWIYCEIIASVGPDGRDTNSRIRLSNDTVWTPAGITGTSHFNEIRIYTRNYRDAFLRFKLVKDGYLPIQKQLAAFLQNGSATWPGPSPAPSIK